jgi:hypothetical protein
MTSPTQDLLARLERHYIKPGDRLAGGVFLPEVGWNGGTSLSRADALYVGFTGSSGRLLVGHEIKVSRADWRKELDTPGKADAWADQCHAWYVVAPSMTIVGPDELPDGWGLLIPNARSSVRMDIIVKAHVHRSRQPSWDAVRSLLARADTLRASAIAAEALRARDKAQAEVEERVTLALKHHTTDDSARVRQQLDALCTALGLDNDSRWGISDHDIARVARAATFLRAYTDVHDAAQALTHRYRGSTDTIRRNCDQLDQALTRVAAVTNALHPVSNQEATA